MLVSAAARQPYARVRDPAGTRLAGFEQPLRFASTVATSAIPRSGGSFGYLLKDRVLDVDEFLEAAHVTHGGSALHPEVVKQLLAPPQDEDALADLTPREREVPGLMNHRCVLAVLAYLRATVA